MNYLFYIDVIMIHKITKRYINLYIVTVKIQTIIVGCENDQISAIVAIGYREGDKRFVDPDTFRTELFKDDNNNKIVTTLVS